MMSSPLSLFKQCAAVAFLLLVVLCSPTAAEVGEASPIASPTLAVGSNPQFTPNPESQKGTLGPTAQINLQKFGETFSPAPTIEATDAPDTSNTGAPSQPPAIQIAVGMTGVAAALL